MMLQELIGYDPSISHAPRTSLLDSSAASAVASKQVTTADVPSGQLWLTDSEMTTFPTALHVATLPVIGFDGVCIGVLQVGKRQSAPSFTTVQLTVLDVRNDFMHVSCVFAAIVI